MLAQIKEVNEQIKLATSATSSLKTAVFSFAQTASVLTHEGVVRATIGSDRVFDEDLFRDKVSPETFARCIEFSKSEAKRQAPQEYEASMRAPKDVHEQKRVLRIKEAKS